jgi:8-amino-7-oxononanoate synthase
LEEQLARIYSCEAALVFNSGYDANLGLFASVPQRGDFIFYDEYAHASIREGIRLSNAKSYKFQHNNLIDLKAKIERAIKADSKIAPYEIYVVTESVFSMDGDAPDLRTLAAFCATNTYHLIVDEAHAIGVYGEGLCVAEAIQRDVFARIVTFGKALGSHGAAILGTYLLKEYLINFAKSFIYTTALPPHSIATSIAAHELLVSKTGSISQTKLLENINYFKQELEKNGLKSNFIESNSAIQCMKVNGNQNVKNSSVKLVEKGFDVKPILSPTVPKGKERLRFCLHAYNTKKEIKSLVQILKNI